MNNLSTILSVIALLATLAYIVVKIIYSDYDSDK